MISKTEVSKIDDDTLFKCICASINNDNYIFSYNNQKRTRTYQIKYAFWLIILLWFSPRKSIEAAGKFICIFSSNNEKRYERFFCNYVPLYFAKMNQGLKQIRRNNSVLSPFSRIERIKLYVSALRHLQKHRDCGEYDSHRGMVVEFFLIARFLELMNITEIATAISYDRYTTLITYLTHELNIFSVGIQEGAAIDIGIPNKLYFDECRFFDEYEAKEAMKFIKECKSISYIGFYTNISWDIHGKTTHKKIIAFASQDWYTDDTLVILRAILSNPILNEHVVILYPHYREHIEQYKKLVDDFPMLVVEEKKRYSDIDVLVTFYSTIVYDYWSINPNLEVVCFPMNKYSAAYYGRKNVYVENSIDRLINKLSEIVQSE